MRKILIAALILAGGCDATRRDFGYCNATYSECGKGFTCNQSTGKCEPETDGGVDAPFTSPDVNPTVDVSPGEVAMDTVLDTPAPVDVSPIDVAPSEAGPGLDGPRPVDVAKLDTGNPDAPNSCGNEDADCLDPALPFCVNQRCVACKASTDCKSASLPFCSAQNTCVSCALAGAGFCTGSTPACDTGSGRCVECVANGGCTKDPSRAFCVANTCQGCNAPGASSGGGVSTDGGMSSDGGGIDASVLPACMGAKPVCASSGTMAGQCVECVDNAACSGTKPICSEFACKPCTSDSQCTTGPGICMYHQDGRCASDAETIYVKKTAGCSGGAGTASSPYCDTQAAVNAVSSSKRVLALKGPASDALLPISSTPSGSQISIIGLNGATTAAGAAVGIHVTAGDVYIRGVTVANGSDRGILVEAGATVRMEKCVIKNNAGGGLKVQPGASFDVANSVFEENGASTGSEVMPFGGILLGGSAPTSGPHRVWFTTIINNEGRGVVCVDSSQALTGMLIFNNVGGGYANCVFDSTNSKWDSPGTGSDVSDPKFATDKPPYHLSQGSRCKDFVDATLAHPLYDLDGDMRPYPANGKLDCGADEYVP